MKEKIMWVVVCIAIGLVIGYFLLPHVPDVKVVTEWRVKEGSGTTTSTTVSSATITGATSATLLPNGSAVVSGVNLSIATASKTEATIVTHYIEKEKIIDKTVNYAGAVSIGVNPFDLSDYCVTAQYDILKPIFLEAIIRSRFSTGDRSAYIAVGIRF